MSPADWYIASGKKNYHPIRPKSGFELGMIPAARSRVTALEDPRMAAVNRVPHRLRGEAARRFRVRREDKVDRKPTGAAAMTRLARRVPAITFKG